MSKNIIFLYILCFLGIIVTSCNEEKEEEKEHVFIFDEKTFKSEWEKWNNHEIKNYSFTLISGKKNTIDLFNSRSTSAPPPLEPFIEEWKIVVKNSKMNSLEYTYYAELYEGNNFIGFYPKYSDQVNTPLYTTISDIYQHTSISIDSLRTWKLDMNVIINYDQDFNYITFFHVYRLLYDRDGNGIKTFVVSDFKILE